MLFDYEAFSTTPALPPVDGSCCVAEPTVLTGLNRSIRVLEPTLVLEVNTADNDVRTLVRENNHHVYFNRTRITQVNRNHLHTQRLITNENNYHTYLTNYVTRVNDVHRQRIEHLPGERRIFTSFQQRQATDPALCLRAA